MKNRQEEEKKFREKMKKSVSNLIDLFAEYMAQFGDYTTLESRNADKLNEADKKQLETEISKSKKANLKQKAELKKSQQKPKTQKAR